MSELAAFLLSQSSWTISSIFYETSNPGASNSVEQIIHMSYGCRAFHYKPKDHDVQPGCTASRAS